MAEIKTCLNCGTPFKPYRSTQKFCSTKGKGVCKKEHYKKGEQVEQLQAEVKKIEPVLYQAEDGHFPKPPKEPFKNQNFEQELAAQQAEKEEKKEELTAKKGLVHEEEEEEQYKEAKKLLEMLETMHLEEFLEEENEEEELEGEKPLEMLESLHLEEENEEEQEEQAEQEEEEEQEEVFDLSKHLIQPTKDKTLNPDLAEEEEEAPPLDNEDFDQEQVEQIEEEKNKNLRVTRDLETDAVKVMMAPKKAAKVSISFLSAINDLALPFIHKKASFTKSEENHLKNLARLSKQKNLDSFSKEDRSLLDKWNTHEEYKELVPWDEEEKEDLAIPLEELFKGTDGKGMSPFWALMIVLITILSSRLIPVGQAYAERGKGDLKYLETEKEEEPKNEQV